MSHGNVRNVGKLYDFIVPSKSDLVGSEKIFFSENLEKSMPVNDVLLSLSAALFLI